jgi:hypothetical protein
VQNHGVHRDKLFALKPINQEASGLRVIEIRELLLYEVEAFYRAAIIVLIVTTISRSDIPLILLGSHDIGFIGYDILGYSVEWDSAFAANG